LLIIIENTSSDAKKAFNDSMKNGLVWISLPKNPLISLVGKCLLGIFNLQSSSNNPKRQFCSLSLN